MTRCCLLNQQVKMSGKTRQEKFPGPATETEAQAEQQGKGECCLRVRLVSCA